MHSPRYILALGLAGLFLLSGLAPAQKVRNGIVTYPDGYVIELGEPGELPPLLEAGGTTAPASILNGPEEPAPRPFLGGGATQRLLAVAAGAGGFTAAWNDSRDGNVALFLGVLDATGERPVGGAPVHLPRSSRQTLPDLAMLEGAADGILRGGIAWTAQEMAGSVAMLRFFEAPPKAEPLPVERPAAAYLLDLPIPLSPLDGPTPVRLALAGEVGFVAWTQAGTLGGMRLLRNPETGRFSGRGRLALVEGIKPAGGLFELALDPAGHAVVVWAEAAEGSGELTLKLAGADLNSDAEPELRELGPGRPLGVEDDGSGGFWLLAARGGEVLLEHLDADGTPSAGRAEVSVASGSPAAAHLATWGNGDGAAVLIEGQRVGGASSLHVFAPSGARLTPEKGLPALDAEAVDARDVRLAARGTSFLVAWTDSRNDAGDVYFRLVDLAHPDRAAERWNQDEGAADQVHASVSATGARALVAWEDGRRGTSEVFTRAVSADEGGALLKLDREGPLASKPTGAQAFPAVALGTSGHALVTWKEDLGRGSWILRGQITDALGRPLGGALDLDPGFTASRKFPAACLALPSGAGFMVAWVREDPENDPSATVPLVRRIGAAGEVLGRAHRLTERPATDARNLSMALSDTGEVLCVWDQHGLTTRRTGKKPGLSAARSLAGRLMTPDGSPLGRVLSFPPSPEGGDFDPAVAPVLGGGYLLAWTGNEGPTRDVFARFLDPRGRPNGPPLGVSVRAGEQDYPSVVRLEDGRLFVAWEDDISGIDHGFIREVRGVRAGAGRRAELGERYLVDSTETLYVEDRHAPLLAPFGRGLLAVWDDLSRGLGHDVAARPWLPK